MNSKNSDYHILVVMQSICSPYILTKTPELQTSQKYRKYYYPFTQNVCLSRSDKIELKKQIK